MVSRERQYNLRYNEENGLIDEVDKATGETKGSYQKASYSLFLLIKDAQKIFRFENSSGKEVELNSSISGLAKEDAPFKEFPRFFETYGHLGYDEYERKIETRIYGGDKNSVSITSFLDTDFRDDLRFSNSNIYLNVEIHRNNFIEIYDRFDTDKHNLSIMIDLGQVHGIYEEWFHERTYKYKFLGRIEDIENHDALPPHITGFDESKAGISKKSKEVIDCDFSVQITQKESDESGENILELGDADLQEGRNEKQAQKDQGDASLLLLGTTNQQLKSLNIMILLLLILSLIGFFV